MLKVSDTEVLIAYDAGDGCCADADILAGVWNGIDMVGGSTRSHRSS